MRVPAEVRCISCPLAFCCANCRRAHERTAHNLKYECPICRSCKFLCSEDNVQNGHLLKHLAEEHLPLHCGKCGKTFATMDDLNDIGKCITITEESENETTTNIINEEKEIEDRFNSLYEKISGDFQDQESDENFEAIISINTNNNTAVITPVLSKKIENGNLSSSEDEDGENCKLNSKSVHTPHPKKKSIPRLKRSATPHFKKFLMRQIAQDIEETDLIDDDCKSLTTEKEKEEATKGDTEISGVQALQETDNTRTPSRVLDTENLEQEEINTPPQCTPTSHTLKVDKCVALASAVTTSTPTHPATQWALFPEPGADSPLSEIEGTAENGSTSRQCSLNESSKGDMDSNPSKSLPKKLKSIIVIGPRVRVEGQDSSEKQVTFADSACSEDCSSASKIKKVKFAENTKFDDAKPKRVFRRPKRLLTPGPHKMRKLSNPRFQALINQFESQGMTMARTPIYRRDNIQQATDLTPAMSELVSSLPARAINFKEDSPTIENVDHNLIRDSPANELFKSCIESPAIPSSGNLNTAIAAFTTNIAGSIQACLSSALQTSDDATEIQFKFVITRKKVSIRRIVDDGKVVNENSSEFERHSSEREGGDNIWTTITRAVKNVFRSKHSDKENLPFTTPLAFAKATGSLERQASASKRKCEEISDSDSPLNHKRYKYTGRIRGRRPLPRMLAQGGVCSLKMSHSAEQQCLARQMSGDLDQGNLNQSF